MIKDYLESVYGIGAAPRYIAGRCLARKILSNQCTVCAQICPAGIYPTGKRKRPVWDQCIKCGLCAAACPAKAITPPGTRVNSFIMALSRRGTLNISCEEGGQGNILEVRCIAAVSFEQLACAALAKGVIIHMQNCSLCSREYEKSLIDANLKQLERFLGRELFSHRVTVLDGSTPREIPKESLSRRELLNFVSNLSVDKAFAMLPGNMDSTNASLFYKAMLANAVDTWNGDEGKSVSKFTVMLPRFSENCYNCGYCVKACPNGALRIMEGERNFTVAVDVWKCTGCGVCMDRCRSAGIMQMAPMKVPHLRTVGLGRYEKHVCSVCARPYPKDVSGDKCTMCKNSGINQVNNETIRV